MQRGESVGQPVGEGLGRGELERRLGALASAGSPGALHLHLTHSPFPMGPKASGSPVLTIDGGERVVSCVETEHRDLDGIDLGSWTGCSVVGSTVLIAKDHSCVALIKLADGAGLQVVEGGIG